jgi:hypothetical protein
MRAELLRERLFVVTSVDSNRLKSHSSRVLNSKMAQAADAVYCHDVSGASA